MAYTNDPTRDIDRVRLSVGDTDVDNEYISDTWYQYFLDNNSANEKLAAIDAAKAILAKFTANTREKVDQVEIYGNQQFDNYLQWLKDFIENPSLSGILSPVPYLGGLSKQDMRDNNTTIDNNRNPLYTGFVEEGCDTLTDNYNKLVKDC